MRLLGIVHAYNEEDCVGSTLRLLLNADHDVHIFDHGSTDGTAEIAHELVALGLKYHRLDREEIPIHVRGQQSPALWQTIGDFIRGQRGTYDWVTWLDADELLRDPAGGLVSRTTIEDEVTRGTQIIRPLLREFWVSDADDEKEEDFRRRLLHFRFRRRCHCPRAWLLRLTPKRMPRCRHIADPRLPSFRLEDGRWPKETKVSNNEWLLDHYPVRSVEQGRRKIQGERPWRPPQYQAFRKRKCQNLVKPSKSMERERRKLPMP